jgi:hypothetical protein
MTTQNNPAKSKKNVRSSILNAIHKLFSAIRVLVEIIFSIIKNLMNLMVYFMRFLVETLADPSMPAVVAIIFFALVMAITGYQWWGIGVWLFSMFGLTQVWGVAGGMFGLLLGYGINVYQLNPELWKLQPLMAKAYDRLNIDPEAQLDKPNLKQKLDNWLSFDHKTLKGMRLMSYSIETGLVLTYTAFVGQFQFWSICIAAASLLLPEMSLKGLAAT